MKKSSASIFLQFSRKKKTISYYGPCLFQSPLLVKQDKHGSFKVSPLFFPEEPGSAPLLQITTGCLPSCYTWNPMQFPQVHIQSLQFQRLQAVLKSSTSSLFLSQFPNYTKNAQPWQLCLHISVHTTAPWVLKAPGQFYHLRMYLSFWSHTW